MGGLGSSQLCPLSQRGAAYFNLFAGKKAERFMRFDNKSVFINSRGNIVIRCYQLDNQAEKSEIELTLLEAAKLRGRLSLLLEKAISLVKE